MNPVYGNDLILAIFPQKFFMVILIIGLLGTMLQISATIVGWQVHLIITRVETFADRTDIF
jgi:hypothetical protein